MEQVYRYERGSIHNLGEAKRLISNLEDIIYGNTYGSICALILVKSVPYIHKINVDIYKPDDYPIINMMLNKHDTNESDSVVNLYYGVRGQRIPIIASKSSSMYVRPTVIYPHNTDWNDATIFKENTVNITLHYWYPI